MTRAGLLDVGRLSGFVGVAGLEGLEEPGGELWSLRVAGAGGGAGGGSAFRGRDRMKTVLLRTGSAFVCGPGLG